MGYLVKGGLVAAVLGLAACGNSVPEQALFGAGAGALGAAALGGNAATGAVVGAAGNVLYCQQFPHLCR
ncbi:MAG: hypothetical protein JJU40_03170 [Rhodobacteraceae bacterium]|jgi:hypothetical protein|nr:hypothetical protein [Paracoccaceae bacterium]